MRTAFQESLLGWRAVRFASAGEPVKVWLDRTDRPRLRLGSIHDMRYRGQDAASGLHFLDTDEGLEAVLRDQRRFAEGACVSVVVIAEAQSEKRARVGLMDGREPQSFRQADVDVRDGLAWSDEAEDAFQSAMERLSGRAITVCPGVSLRLGRTPALTAIDVDWHTTRRSQRALTEAVMDQAMALIALSGAGGIIAIDYKTGSRREDRARTQSAAGAGITRYKLDARLDPVGPSGLVVMTRQHAARPILDWLLDEQGRARAETAFLLAAMRAEDKLARHPSLRFLLLVPARIDQDVHKQIKDWLEAAHARYGYRLAIVRRDDGKDHYSIEDDV
jgi:Ribonuclease G/E